MRRPFIASWIASFLVVGVTGGAAMADRVSPLEGQPAVRHKFELRDGRFEVTPTFELSLMAPWRNTFSVGTKISYHLTDAFSIEGLFFFGFSSNTGVMN